MQALAAFGATAPARAHAPGSGLGARVPTRVLRVQRCVRGVDAPLVRLSQLRGVDATTPRRRRDDLRGVDATISQTPLFSARTRDQ